MRRFAFRFRISLGGALSLGACAASRPAHDPAQVQLRLEAQAPRAYNIVWLRATLRNHGPRPVWLSGLHDSIYEPPQSLWLTGRTPKGDSLDLCAPWTYKAMRPRYTRLRPGTERTVFLRVDFNRVFPKAFLDSLAAHDSPDSPDCGQFFNRTPGPYQFRVNAYAYLSRPAGYKPRRRNQDGIRAKSNPVTVVRPQ